MTRFRSSDTARLTSVVRKEGQYEQVGEQESGDNPGKGCQRRGSDVYKRSAIPASSYYLTSMSETSFLLLSLWGAAFRVEQSSAQICMD